MSSPVDISIESVKKAITEQTKQHNVDIDDDMLEYISGIYINIYAYKYTHARKKCNIYV